MSYKILRITEKPLELIEYAGRTCYDSLDNLGKDTELFIKNIIKRGHTSVLEHASMTVEFSDISRGMTHEEVRHRHSGFSQQSTRYTLKKGDFNLIYKADNDKESEFFKKTESILKLLLQEGIDLGITNDKLRQVAPIGIPTKIIHTANFREWRHIFEQRTVPQAHWEIREEMTRLLQEVKKLVPVVFDF